MSEKYLKATVKPEPLIWQWYAWPYLIPPLSAGCNIAERHLKIMNSYVQNPQIHCQAAKDPKLLGGPFIDLNGQHVQEIRTLIEQTEKDCSTLLELQNAYKHFDQILQNEAQGDTLESLYERMPTVLRGLVELVYDLNNHPSMRFIEKLLYNRYYSSNGQCIALSETLTDSRKFVLSTPRIDQNDEVYLKTPFSDKNLDELFKMKSQSGNSDEMIAAWQVPQEKQSLMQSFFTEVPPFRPEDRNYTGEGVRIRYFGHACLLVQTKSVSVLIDPVISYPIEKTDVPRYSFLDLPDHIDYVVITHNHQDHILFETLLQLRHKIGHIAFPSNQSGFLADPSLKLILEHTGFSSLIELGEMDVIPLPDGKITALPFLGEHSDLNIQTKRAYGIELLDRKILLAADSNNLDPVLYEHIHRSIGDIDMFFLGMECDGAPLTWLYGPLLSKPLKRTYDKNRSLSGSSYEKAWAIVEKMRCKEVYVYAMGKEPWLSYIMALEYSPESLQITESNRLIEKCQNAGIPTKRLFGRQEWIIYNE